MRRAIEIAGRYRPHPNPRVGAVIVSPSGEIIAEGAHEAPGEPHAEVVAIRQAGNRAKGATLVVTLEPCAHHGRTPPCTKAVVDAGISAVIVGAIDPDERVEGRGVAELRSRGVQVTTGVLANEVRFADRGYFHHRATGRPLIRLKLAMTIDGQVAARDGTSRWISGVEARADAHELRAAADAVMVGAGTIIADDPQLNVRLPAFDGLQPRPIVIAGSRSIPDGAAVLGRNPLVYSDHPLDVGAEVQVVPSGADGVDLRAVAKDLAARGHLEILTEGGPRLAGSLMRAGLVSHLTVYVAALAAGGSGFAPFLGPWATLAAATPIEIERVERIGADVRIDARVST